MNSNNKSINKSKNGNVLKLVLRDINLSLHPVSIFFIVLAAGTLFIPSYPRATGFLYIIISVMNMFTFGLQYKEHEFSGLLPVRKREVVKARFITVLLLELGTLVLSVPFAYLASKFVTIPFAQMQAAAGKSHTIIESGLFSINATMYACVLIGYAVLNIILLPGGYRKSFKVALRGALSIFGFMMLCSILGVASGLISKELPWLTASDGASVLKQLPILAGALAVYALLTVLSYNSSKKSFERAEI